MPFLRPNRGDPVVVEDFGQPVFDALRRTGGSWRRNTVQAIPATTWTYIAWDTELTDTDNFAPPASSVITIPPSLPGVYTVTACMYIGGPNAALQVLVGGFVDNLTALGDPVTGAGTVSFTLAMSGGTTLQARVYSNVAVNVNGYISLWRVGI